jgi:ribonuclease VapC
VIIDTSALIAIMKGEAESESFVRSIHKAPARRLSAANFLEASILVDSARDAIARRRFDDLLVKLGIVIEPVTESQARIAREAYRDFGKGGGHKAKLNFGDCFAYALARETGEPLLFKGNDFSRTDIVVAIRKH